MSFQDFWRKLYQEKKKKEPVIIQPTTPTLIMPKEIAPSTEEKK